MTLENVVEADVLVIGGGIAGCFAAIKARERGLDATIVDKAYAGKSGGTRVAGFGYVVFNPEWGHDLDTWMNAINKKGEYINNREWTEIVLKESWTTYQALDSWGVDFTPESVKSIDPAKALKIYPPFAFVNLGLTRTGPPSRKQAVKSGVKIMDGIMVTDLLKQDEKVVGAIGFSPTSYDSYIFKAKATIVSSGIVNFRSVAEIANLTGDGEAMAYRAGAELTSKEFPDEHVMPLVPTGCLCGEAISYANYIDAEGERIDLSHTHETRLALDFAFHAGEGPIFWDLDSATPEVIEKMCERQDHTPWRHEAVRSFDPRNRGKYRIAGGAWAGGQNSHTGGIWPINTKCATTLPGLYAAGETCGTRFLGADHPVPGFGLLGAAVTGSRAGLGAAEYALQAEEPTIDEEELARLKKIMNAPAERKGGVSPRWMTQILRNTMIPYFIIHIKQGERLQAALTIVEFLEDHLVPKLTAKDGHELRLAHETKNMVLHAEMILRTSLFRTESRGTHYREDYPRRDDSAWLAWVKLQEEQGKMKLWKEPVPKEWWPDLSKPYEERYPLRFPGE